MKEVFTKKFWEGVKKTFDEAREDPPPANTASEIQAESEPSASPTSETPSQPSVSSERPLRHGRDRRLQDTDAVD